MSTIIEVLRRLLPRGTRVPTTVPSWDDCPRWPPDAYAVAATLLNMSGGYSAPRFISYFPDGKKPRGRLDDLYRARVEKAATIWRQKLRVPRSAQRAWSILVAHADHPVSESPISTRPSADWWYAAMKLVSIADSASAGLGFIYDVSDKGSLFQDYAILAAAEQETLPPGRVNKRLPYIPNSYGLLVPPSEVCVQPKAATSQVGCALRSLSHNLALLPPEGEVTSYWFTERGERILFEDQKQPDGSTERICRSELNLLLVPFPYVIEDDAFKRQAWSPPGALGFFDVDQTWLRPESGVVTGKDLADFIGNLIQESGEEVHGVIFPELSLTDALASHAADELMRSTKLEFFVAGVGESFLDETGSEPNQKIGLPRNELFVALLDPYGPSENRDPFAWVQAKHHRWKLTRSQIDGYGLSTLQNPTGDFWEGIDISNREVFFWTVRYGTVLGALICEDLARIDPVQTVFRAVGPTLVLALLMDGPQIQQRWSGRAALALADDPGSSVLSMTSVGLIKRDGRSARAKPTRSRCSRARELRLWLTSNCPAGHTGSY